MNANERKCLKAKNDSLPFSFGFLDVDEKRNLLTGSL